MKRQTITLIDDLNGKTASETVSFALDRMSYVIDLDKRNAARLRKALAAYISAGRYRGKVIPRSR